jgi:hypothetical protein
MSFHERRILVCLYVCVRSRLRRSGAEGWAASTRHRQGASRCIRVNLRQIHSESIHSPSYYALSLHRHSSPFPHPPHHYTGPEECSRNVQVSAKPRFLTGASHPANVGRNDLWMVFATLTCPSVCWCFSSCAAGIVLSVRILAA